MSLTLPAAMLIGGAITAVSSVINGAINAHNTNKVNQQNIDYSREAAATAQANSKELLDYNSPSYEMGRLIDAGLNPNLAYQGNLQSVPTGAQPAQPNLRVPDMSLDLGVDEALKIAQINRLNAASDNETELTDAQVKNLYKGLDLKDAQIQSLYEQAKLFGQTVSESKARASLYTEQQRGAALDNLFKDATFTDRYRALAAERGISETNAKFMFKYLTARVLNLDRQSQYYLSQCNVNEKTKDMLVSLSNLYDKQAFGQLLLNKENTVALAAQLSPTTAGVPLLYQNVRSKLKSQFATTALVEEQNKLLRRYGDAEHTVDLIQSIVNILSTLEDDVFQFLPTYNKTSVGGVVNRSKTSNFPIP